MDNYERERHASNVRMLLHMVDDFPSPFGQALLEIIAADYRALIDAAPLPHPAEALARDE